jgi:hypothetical protein
MRRELADFLDYCRLERRLAPLTCSAYERDVGTCLAFLEREGIVTISEVRPADLRRFLADEAIRRPSLSSQARTVAALKCFFRFLLENEQIDRDPALVLRTPHKGEALPDVLDRRDLARYSVRPSATMSGSASMTVSASATGSCSRSSHTPGSVGASCSGSTGRTSTSNGGCSRGARRKADGGGSCRFTPPSSRSSPTTFRSGRTIPNRPFSLASRAAGSRRRS